MSRRILLLITDLKIGGTPTVVRELARRLNEPGRVEIEVACLAPWGPVADQLRDVRIPVTALGAAGPRDLRAIARLVHLIKRRRFDTVFSFLMHANAAAAIASRFCRGVRFIQSIQTTQPNPAWHWTIQRVVQHAAERIVVPSESAANVARDWADVDASRVVVIPNAVDVSGFHYTSSRTLNDPVRVGFLGRLDPIKRVGDLLAAVAVLSERPLTPALSPGYGGEGVANSDTRRISDSPPVPSPPYTEERTRARGRTGEPDRTSRVHLEIFGDGAKRHSLESRAAELGLHDLVTFHGAVSRPQNALEQIDILILPSQAEGFGLVLIEAMSAGIPVVATDVPGIRDVVRHERTGLLVPVASPAQLAGAIARLVGDAQLRSRLAAAARADVEARFTWPAVLRQYRRLLGLE